MIRINLIAADGRSTQLYVKLARSVFLTISETENLHVAIRKFVSQYGGKYYNGKYSPGYIIFDNEEKASFFVLKFS